MRQQYYDIYIRMTRKEGKARMITRKTRSVGVWGVTALLVASITTFAEERTKKTPHLYETPAERRDVANIILQKGVSVGGMIEVEAYTGKENGETVSDIVLATFELGIEAELSEWVQGRALLLWEEDDTDPVNLDEAMIILGGNKVCPAYLRVGKMYVPFGTFNSHFISDSLALELAETRESAMLAGFASGLLDISVGAFNGDGDEDSEKANDLFAACTLNICKYLQIGGYWISSIGESDALEEMIIENAKNNEDENIEYSSAEGAGGFISLQIGRFVAEAEYITAIEGFAPGVLAQTELQPAAWNVEAGIRFNVCEAEIALKHEGCNDFPGFPEKQYGISSSIKISESATLAIEYLHGEFKDNTEDRNVVTTQLAMEF